MLQRSSTMIRIAAFALVLGGIGLGLFPGASHACIHGYPAEKIVAIDATLRTTKLKTAKFDEVKALREQAGKASPSGHFYDANRAADRALALLDVKFPASKNPTRC
jgi:hypothetical protein